MAGGPWSDDESPVHFGLKVPPSSKISQFYFVAVSMAVCTTEHRQCGSCEQRISLTISFISCCCGLAFCDRHRAPEHHAGGFDWQGMQRSKLTRENPKTTREPTSVLAPNEWCVEYNAIQLAVSRSAACTSCISLGSSSSLPTGGLLTDWKDVHSWVNIGFLIVEVHPSGEFLLTKPERHGRTRDSSDRCGTVVVRDPRSRRVPRPRRGVRLDERSH